jgi:hypothetical protein
MRILSPQRLPFRHPGTNVKIARSHIPHKLSSKLGGGGGVALRARSRFANTDLKNTYVTVVSSVTLITVPRKNEASNIASTLTPGMYRKTAVGQQ